MTICIAFQVYLNMARAHMDIPANHAQINEGAIFLQELCKKSEEKPENKKDSVPKK